MEKGDEAVCVKDKELTPSLVYLFRRDEGGTDHWGLAGRFQPGDPAARDQFGISVALSGDTLLVGAAMKDIGGPEAGAASVFQAYRALFLPLIRNN